MTWTRRWMTVFLGVALAWAALGGTPPTRAAGQQPAQAWRIDLDHCTINFAVRHIFVQIPGKFKKFGGTIRFEEHNLAGSSIDVSVDTDSVDTDQPKRDEDLRSPNFFDAARYPQMRFVSSRIERKGGNEFVAYGKLTIKDVTRDIELPFRFLGSRDNPLKPGTLVAGFESHLSVRLLDYNVDGDYIAKGVVGETADITLLMELQGEPAGK